MSLQSCELLLAIPCLERGHMQGGLEDHLMLYLDCSPLKCFGEIGQTEERVDAASPLG
jgi:hypothetical protein